MGHHHHQHDHHHVSGKNLGLTVLLNVIITIAQVIGGLVSGSVALLSDALHNFSDVISLILTWFTNRLARRKPTIRQTYGYKRAEILSAFINAVTLIAIAVFIVAEAIGRISNPQPVLSDWVIYFALASIVINTLSVVLLQKESKNNMNIRSAYLHLLTDVLTSIAVMTGGILMKYYQIYWIDAVLSILIAIYLIYSSYQLLIDSLKILMQFTPKDINIITLSEEISRIPEIKNIHHIHFWQLTDKDLFFEAHIDLSRDIRITDFQIILAKIENILSSHHISHCNIQPEYSVSDGKELIVHH